MRSPLEICDRIDELAKEAMGFLNTDEVKKRRDALLSLAKKVRSDLRSRGVDASVITDVRFVRVKTFTDEQITLHTKTLNDLNYLKQISKFEWEDINSKIKVVMI